MIEPGVLMQWYIVISLNIGEIIIIGMVIARRTPYWLQVNIYANAYSYLGV
jgi:hypothetical protein